MVGKWSWKLTWFLCIGRIPEQPACPVQTELQNISCARASPGTQRHRASVEPKCWSRLAARKTGGREQLSSMIGGGQTLRVYSRGSGHSESVITHNGRRRMWAEASKHNSSPQEPSGAMWSQYSWYRPAKRPSIRGPNIRPNGLK